MGVTLRDTSKTCLESQGELNQYYEELQCM